MKTFIALLVIMTASVFSQGWNTVVQTTIPFSSASKVDLTTNRDGNHILLTYAAHPTYYLRYYLVNSSGTVIRNYTFETQEVQFANIDGTNDRIYVVYKLGNQIKTRKSTNAGQNWNNIADINIGNNTCNHVDITFGKDDNALHVVWATQDNGNDYETYYKRLASDNSWGITETVTDGSNVGGFPTVSKSQYRVHVSYNTGQSWDPETNLGDAKSRDKYINTWQTPQLVFSTNSFRERIHAGSSKLLDFYYKLETGMGQYHADLYVKVRNFGSTSWSSPQILQQFSGVREIVSAANTFDGKTHIVYEIFDGVGYRNYNGSSWSSEEPIGSGYISPRIYAVSNDLFVAWGKDAPAQNKFIHYRQYDAAPLAPQNLTITKSANNHPLLSWLPNTEPDRNYYQLYKWDSYGGGWQPLAQTSNTSYEDATLTYCTAIPPAQCPDLRSFQFKVTAVDLGSHESDPSNIVESRLVGGPPSKARADDPDVNTVLEYSLVQNYPNPFNPTTTINYSLKTAGEVTLKVYDMLGTEVASLVNERQDAGSYTVEFNAANLPSGMYVYRLSAANFVDTKKLILLK